MEHEKPVLTITVGEDKIIHLLLDGKLTKEHLAEFQAWADKVYETMLRVREETGQNVKFLTNVTHLEALDEEVMKVYADLLKKDTPYVYRSATFGASKDALTWLVAVMTASGRKNFKHFQTREEALAWLNKEAPTSAEGGAGVPTDSVGKEPPPAPIA